MPKPPEPYLGPPRVPGQPAISSAAAVLMDAESGRILWEWHQHQRMYPASLTKMMSGLLAVEQGNLDRVVVASKRAADTGESSIALAAGEKLTLRQVLQASLIKSANDATVMLAEAVGGSVEQFVELMNQSAVRLGLDDTHFTNPHGLHSPEHYSSAHDLALLAWEGLRHPDFASIVATRRTTIPWPGKPWERVLINRNRLLLRWPACDGVKTGYTRQAGRCLVAAATENDWRLLCVVLKCKDSWQDARNLLQWGFGNFQHVRLAEAGKPVYRVRVRYGRRETVIARAEQTLGVTVPRGSAFPELEQSRKPATAPVAMGETVGWLYVQDNGHLRSVRLLACENVSRSLWGQVRALRLPEIGLSAIILLAAGVLLHGAGTKTARTRRRRLPARKRKPDSAGPSDRGRGTGGTR